MTIMAEDRGKNANDTDRRGSVNSQFYHDAAVETTGEAHEMEDKQPTTKSTTGSENPTEENNDGPSRPKFRVFAIMVGLSVSLPM